MIRSLSALALVATLAAGCREAPATDSSPAPAPAAAEEREEDLGHLTLPDVTLTDADGHAVRLPQLAEGRTVVLSFVFTRCTTICPPIGLGFSKLRKALGDRAGKEVQLISITLDPENDTPAALREWGDRYGRGPGWTLLTGSNEDIEKVLRALRVYTAAKEQHAPLVLLGDHATKRWVRAYGLSTPAELLRAVERVQRPAPDAAVVPASTTTPAAPNAGAASYFGELALVDQDNKRVSLYRDLLKGRKVVLHSFFTTCGGSCPVVMRTLGKLQDKLGDRLGPEVTILSITVDPENDTPARLKEYAARVHAKPGWRFLTGTQEDVDLALKKIGQYVEQRDNHSPVVIAGNEGTGLWKKAFGLAEPEKVIDVLMSVVDDRGAAR
jgi:cytochrome oxidase Cu insertion factor (SCO1/SenC/PrrC family)